MPTAAVGNSHDSQAIDMATAIQMATAIVHYGHCHGHRQAMAMDMAMACGTHGQG